MRSARPQWVPRDGGDGCRPGLWRWLQLTDRRLGHVPSSASGPVTVVSPTEKDVDVGGYRLFLHCEGTGSPTVVFENGFGGIESDWENVRSNSDTLRSDVFV